MDRVTASFPGVNHGDRVRVIFAAPWREEGRTFTEVTGRTTIIVGRLYVSAEGTQGNLGMPVLVTIEPEAVESIEILQTSEALQEEAHRRARGELVFRRPGETAREIVGQLETLAEMIVSTDHMNPRRRQLQHQFNDIADIVELAETKRTYLLTKAKLGWSDFNPWETKTDDVYRIKTVRPLPADFEPSRDERRNRQRRLDEAVRIFGEAERETRCLMSWLRFEGFDVRRGHPNGFEVKVKVDVGERAGFDIVLSCSKNGLWEMSLPVDNKGDIRRRERAIRRGLTVQVAMVLDRWLQSGRGPFVKEAFSS